MSWGPAPRNSLRKELNSFSSSGTLRNNAPHTHVQKGISSGARHCLPPWQPSIRIRNNLCMQNYVCVVWLTTCIAAAPSEHRVFHTLWGLQLPVTEVVLQTLKNLRLTFCSRVSVKCPSCLREGPYSCTAHTTSPEAKIIRDNKDTSVANDSEKLTASSQIVTGISPGSIRWTQFVSKQHFPRSTANSTNVG